MYIWQKEEKNTIDNTVIYVWLSREDPHLDSVNVAPQWGYTDLTNENM